MTLPYYNFLPPIDQVYPDGQVPSNIGYYNRLDPYLPQYNITTGSLVPLLVKPDGTPYNLNGISGPTGSTGGNSTFNPSNTTNPYPQYSPPATPFMMVSYAQTTKGILQMVLVKGSRLPTVLTYNSVTQINTPTNPNSNSYYFVNASDIIDYSRVTQVYYTIDSNKNIVFYDAEMIQQNPNNNIEDYQLYGYVNTGYSGANTFAFWPSNNQLTNQLTSANISIVETYFKFEEFFNSTLNPNETQLKSGLFYHPANIGLEYPNGGSDGYTNYDNEGYYSGYGYGYPINFNYAYINTSGQLPVIINGNDTYITESGNVWPGLINLSVYNGSVKNIKNYTDVSKIELTINDIGNNNFLNCSCNNNNECSNDDDTYYNNNCNTIQAGVIQFMTYQFIPFQQIKTPANTIVTGVTGTSYNYITYPQNITPTPNTYNENTGGFTGFIPIEIQKLIDGSTGPTGFTSAQSSIISSWMNFPNNTLYDCYREVTPTSYCGFLDYYESLAGLSYDYGYCGNTGPAGSIINPFSAGACNNGQVCVPNFKYFNSYDELIDSPFICVDPNVGITTENINYYIKSVAPQMTDLNTVSIPQYKPYINNPPAPPSDQNAKAQKTKNNIFFYIAIAVLVIIVILFIVFMIINSKKNNKAKQSYVNLVRL